MSIKNKIKPYLPLGLLDIKRRLQGAYPYLPYMDKHKCIFIHVPKTAGSSILSVFMGDDIRRSHKTADCFKSVNPEKFEKYFKFAFVRNPWDKVVSVYEYLLFGHDSEDHKFFRKLFADKYPSFESFVLDYLNKDKIHDHPLFKPQYRYIYDYKGDCMVDFIGRFESIDEDFSFILNRLKIDAKLKKLNKSNRRGYKDYYHSQEVIDKIAYLYSRDIELFKYDF